LAEVLIIVLCLAVGAAVISPVFLKAREGSQPSCMSNLRQLSIVAAQFHEDHGHYPSAATFWQSTPPKARSCSADNRRRIGYGYYAALAGKSLKSPGVPAPSLLPVVADSKRPDYLLRTTADLDFRHAGTAMVGYADGSVQRHTPGSAALPPLASRP